MVKRLLQLQMGYGYRTSILKRGELKAVVLSAEFALKNSTKEERTVKIQQFSAHRKATQPPARAWVRCSRIRLAIMQGD